MTKTKMLETRPIDNLDPGTSNDAVFLVGGNQSFIQWPTEQEVEEVSTRLFQIVRAGILSETNGDYFKSGDLAYQVQEIIRATAELCKKSERAKK